jgi:hypothetical protein
MKKDIIATGAEDDAEQIRRRTRALPTECMTFDHGHRQELYTQLEELAVCATRQRRRSETTLLGHPVSARARRAHDWDNHLALTLNALCATRYGKE